MNDDADPMDDNGHGTHVAGIVAANHQSLTGVAPEATLLAYKVLNHAGSGSMSWVLAGIERAIDPNGDGDPSDRADVVSMSLGGPMEPNDPLIAAVERGTAAGVVFSISAGNFGRTNGLGTPGLAPSAITVGATDLDDKIAFFSSGGPSVPDWGLKPEIAAPGVRTVSAVLDNATGTKSGTSMSAPHVAGVAALIREQHPDWTPRDVKTAIVSTAKPVKGRLTQEDETQNGDVVMYAGSGRVDALGAVNATIFPSPYAAAFGLIRERDESATGAKTVTLTNRGTASETLTLQPPVMPAGVKLTVVPESVTLAPGASVDVQMSVEVAAGAVPNDSGLSFSGVFTFAGTKTTVRIPWTFVRADVLQVTVGGTDEFSLYISDGMQQATMWPEGPRTFSTFVPLLLGADILVLTHPADGSDPRMILREAYEVDGFTSVTISPDEAVHTLRVDGVDERGVPLDDISPDAVGNLWHRFWLPSGGLIKLYYAEGRRSLRVAPWRRTRFQTYETVASGSHQYFGAYRHLRRLNQDETLVLGASDWASQKLRPFCASDCRVAIGAGPGGHQAFDFYEVPKGLDEFTLHLTPEVDPEYDFRAHIVLVEENAEYRRTFEQWTFVSNPLRNVGGRFSTSPLHHVSRAEYFPPERDTPLSLGEGPVVLRASSGKRGLKIEPFGTAVQFHGGHVMTGMQVDVQRLDEGPRGIFHPSEDPAIFNFVPQAGLYRVTATDTFPLAGSTGRVTQTSLFDMRTGVDGPPTLTIMRVENGRGSVSSTVAAGSPSRVVFAARQSTLGQQTYDVTHSRVSSAETKAWWRPHGTAEWLPLSVATTGEDFQYKSRFPGSAGTLYSASLAPAVAAEGAVDLKFSITNFVGGTTEAVYEPAFFVGPQGTRRRAMR